MTCANPLTGIIASGHGPATDRDPMSGFSLTSHGPLCIAGRPLGPPGSGTGTTPDTPAGTPGAIVTEFGEFPVTESGEFLSPI